MGLIAAQAAVIERCHRQSAAGKGRCTELEKYMKRCQRVRATCLSIVCVHVAVVSASPSNVSLRSRSTLLSSLGWLQC